MTTEENTAGNTGLAKVAVQCLNQHLCFVSNAVLADSFVLRNRHLRQARNVTNKPKKKDSDMKIDKTTYKDKGEIQIGLTDNRTSRPNKVLFFADPHFLFKNRPTIGTLPFALHTSQRFAKVKEPILADMYKKL